MAQFLILNRANDNDTVLVNVDHIVEVKESGPTTTDLVMIYDPQARESYRIEFEQIMSRLSILG
jgi:hypothetical protein